MENEVKQRNQRNRRRERAQRMQAQRESKVKDGDSGEDESPAREKPPRPPARRKKSREPLGEEDIIDGFAIMAFRTYEDLEAAVKCASSPRTNLLTKTRLPLAALVADAPRNHPPNNANSHGITLLQDAGTSDDSGRASERLTGSSVAPRDPDSSRDRLSDASSRCSSGKGYICDSEGDDDKASPENSRNASPRYHDASMDDASDAGSLFRVTGATGGGGGGVGNGGGKSELVARGGSGGALALSRAPVGGSASPAPAPLPQPAPSPAPAALPPPALPPPPFRADTPNRSNGAHIPTLDGHAATQIPARPVGAAGPDTPERPASNNNKLQPGARASADSPTPAPPAPPAPSPLFPSHTAYQSQSQSHAAATLPDYRHTNHETRTEAPPQPPAPLDLHAHQAPRPVHHAPATTQASQTSLPSRMTHSQPHPVMPGHDVRNPPTAAPTHPSMPTSFPNRVNGVPPSAPPHSTLSTNSSCLPSQTISGRPVSPAAPASRPYPAPSIASSHINSNLSPSIHGHSIAYQSQSSLQKNTGIPVYASRPSHLAPFSVANHISSSQIPMSTASQTTVSNMGHPINSHSISSHTNHLPLSNPNLLPTSTPPNYISPASSLASTTTTSISNFTSSLKHPGLSLPPHHPSSIATPISLHQTISHLEHSPISTSAVAIVTSATTTSNHAVPPPVVDSRQASITSNELPTRTESPAISSALSSNGYPPPPVYTGASYPPLYAPYAPTLQHSPYLPPAAASPRNSADTRTSLSASPLVAPKTPKGVRPHTPGSTGTAGPTLSYSPRGHSPTRERESFSNISSLSRSTPASGASATVSASLAPSLVAPLAAPLAGSLVPPMAAPLTTPLVGPLGAAGLSAPLSNPLAVGLGAPLAAPTPTPAAPTAPHMAHTLAPVPTVPSISSSAKPPAHWGVTRATVSDRPTGFAPAPPLFGTPLAPPNPNSFSAESLFQTSPGADLLRRELDNRFLAAAGAVGAVRTEMHHHQHQHTHVHQHPPPHAPHAPHAPHVAHAPHAPPPPHPHQMLVPHSPLFKDKMPSLYRTGLSLGYPYSPSLLHPTAPYVPPAPLTTYAPKPVVSAASDSASKPPTRPATVKSGKWNAMHVRIAWEIYNHQQKEKSGGAAVVAGGGDKDKLRGFPAPAPPPPAYRSPYDLPPAPYLHHPHLGTDRRHELGRAPMPIAPLAPSTHFGSHITGVSPFGRYGPGAYTAAPAFSLSAYGRDLALSSSLHGVHHAPSIGALHDPWRGARPPSATAAAEARREHEERERARREREERERREREERERRKAREQRDQRDREFERARARSPLRNGVPEPGKEERKEPPRHAPPPPLGAYPPPPHWDPYRAFDPLQHMRFAPLVEAAIRAEEDRAKMLSAYAHHQQMKSSPLLHRGMPPHGPLPPLGPHSHAPLPPLAPLAPPLAPLAPLDLLKKEEPR